MTARAPFLETYRSSGYAALTASIVALKLFDPFFGMTILAIASASWTFKAATTQREHEREVIREHRRPLIAAIVGSCLVALHILDISFGILRGF